MNYLRILVTGSRDWSDRETIFAALANTMLDKGVPANNVSVVHGKCPTGADKIADELARGMGCRVEGYEADWATHGKAAGPIRNAVMVSLGADICLAFPLGESRGTRSCMRMARNAGIPVVEYGAAS